MKYTKVPDILFEQYALGELPPDKAREVEQSPDFAVRIAQIEQSNAEILGHYPPEQFAERIQNQFAAEVNREESRRTANERSRQRSRRQTAVRYLAFGVPGAAAVIVGVLLAVQTLFGPGLATGTDETGDVVRLKGDGPTLSIYRSLDGPDTEDDEAELLENGAQASEGDRLQLAYNSGEQVYGAIISVDGRGAVFVHYPYSLSGDPDLVPGRTERLHFAYELDDAPDFEHFFFITSAETFSVQQLVQHIRSQAAQVTQRARSLRLPNEFEVTSVTLIKGE